MTRILAFSGSARKGSTNSKLVKIAAEGAKQAGSDVTVIDLADYPMPLYDQDLEMSEGIPENAIRFKKLLLEHEGVLIASPEYNSAFSPLLKNVIDWASRSTTENEPPLSAYRGKSVAIMAASPGGLGGLRGLVFLRMLLGNLGMIVLPEQHAVGNALKAFGESGQLLDETQQQNILNLGKNLVEHLS